MRYKMKNTISREFKKFVLDEQKHRKMNNKTLLNFEKETKENVEIILSLIIAIGKLENKIDNLEKVIAENTVEIINMKAKIEDLKLIETKEEIEKYNLDFIKSVDNEQLLNMIITKILNLTERVRALEK